MAYPKITVNTTQAIHVTPSDSIPIPNPNFLSCIGVGNAVDNGINTSVVTNKLVDSGATFTSTTTPFPVIIGDVVYNTTTPANAPVTAVDSGTTLSFGSNIFEGLEPMSEGKVANDASSSGALAGIDPNDAGGEHE